MTVKRNEFNERVNKQGIRLLDPVGKKGRRARTLDYKCPACGGVGVYSDFETGADCRCETCDGTGVVQRHNSRG